MPEDPPFRIVGVAYHITMRTLGGRKLFADEALAEVLVSVLRRKKHELKLRQFGYVVMPDYCRLLVAPRDEQMSASEVVAHVQAISAVGINEHLGTLDLQWQWETEVEVVYTRESLLDRLSKIHVAPVEAELAPTPEGYPFSSAPFYYRRYQQTQF